MTTGPKTGPDSKNQEAAQRAASLVLSVCKFEGYCPRVSKILTINSIYC
jgi:hypothetical protein